VKDWNNYLCSADFIRNLEVPVLNSSSETYTADNFMAFLQSFEQISGYFFKFNDDRYFSNHHDEWIIRHPIIKQYQ